MKFQWKQVAREGTTAQWAGLYVTLSPKGKIVLSRVTYERLGSPAAFHVLFEATNNVIGLQPTARGLKNAVPVRKSGRHGGRYIAAYRLVVDNNIHLPQTVQFFDAEIDRDGILELDLRTARVPGRVARHPLNRKRKT
jgi:hypothetical protein